MVSQSQSQYPQESQSGMTRRGLLGVTAATAGGLALSALLAACTPGGANEKAVRELTLLSFGGTMPDVVRAFGVKPFVRDNPGISVNVEVSTAAESYPKMLVARNNPSIAGGMFNNMYDARGVADKMWAPFDPRIMTNSASITPGLNPPGGALAMAAQGLGIAYNPNKVDRPKSWYDLFRPEYKGRVALSKGGFDEYLIFTHILGGKTQDVSLGINEWAKYKDNIAAWVASPTQQLQLIDQGDVWLSPMFSSPVITAKESGQNVDFVIPEEGGTMNTQVLRSVVGFDAETTGLTQELLNHHLDPEFQAALVKSRRIGPSSRDVKISDADVEAGVLSADDAQKILIPFDWEWIAQNVSDVRSEITAKVGG